MSAGGFARGCFQRPQRLKVTPKVQQLPANWRLLLCTTGSFTQALEQHTGAPVRVMPLSDQSGARRFSPAGLRRSVRLESADVRVLAHSTITGIATPALKRAFLGLSDTPLMHLLQHQPLCRRPLLQVGCTRGQWYRVGYYRIRRADLVVREYLLDSPC